MWINVDDGTEEEVNINIGHLLQALLGSPCLPMNVDSGLIVFDHQAKRLATVNTCAPSITLSNIMEYHNYAKFQDSFLNIIVGAYGFGIE